MATDFFQRQNDARRGTIWLVFLFGLAVVGIVGMVVAIAAVVVQSQMKEPNQSLANHPEQLWVPLMAGCITLLIIVLGTLFKVMVLRSGGGTQVAESLGGRRIYPNSSDLTERRLLNVVEEMALASGTPVPPVFLMEEAGINAFAAGYSPSDAVLGVTRGCAEQLSRDELQGVIAHEFSHVLNGDMRMSIRLIGILHGILLIGLTGQLIFRMFLYSGGGRSRSSNSNGNGGGQIIILIIAIGVTLLILGFIGTFFGNLIKAAVSRQREYLADASAVQFTRNPSGIAGALKRIGGYEAGSQLQAPSAAEASHMYFAQGVWEGVSGLLATHPPLPKRIRAIEPNWKGDYETTKPPFEPVGRQSAGLASNFAGASASTAADSASSATASVAVDIDEVPVTIVDNAVDYVGDPNVEHRAYAAGLIAQLPPILLDSVREPYGARAVVYALLLDREPDIRAVQYATLQKTAPDDIVHLTRKLENVVDGINVKARLPLVDMALPSLRAMCGAQYAEFRHCFRELARADSKINLFEWTLSQVLLRHLQPQFERVRPTRVQYYSLKQLGPECAALLSTVAAAGNSPSVAKASFDRGAAHLPELKLGQQSQTAQSLGQLSSILAKLATVAPKHRGRLVDACAATICADEHVTWQEAELLRGLSDLLDCPMPPLLVPAASTGANR